MIRPGGSRSRGSATLPLAIVALLAGRAAIGQPPDPKAILSTFELHPEFKIELVATEPQVFSPVDVEFDEHGRPFVMEMLGYPFPNDPGRVVVLDDKDGDGYYETRTVFAEGFAMANSLLPYDGGLLVISPPDILFLKDTNGDDVADVREVVITGLAVENPEDSVNGLTYGLDNWIYAANGGNSGILKWPDGSGEPLPLRGDDLRFDLRHKRMERTGRSAQGFEMSFDNWGNAFTANHTGPLYHRVVPGRFLEGLPQPPGSALHVPIDDLENGLVRIYPIGEQVTRLNHPEQSGYFSGACSPKFYGGGLFGLAFEHTVFTCDVVLNLVHRRNLEPDGLTFVAHRDSRAKKEFLASTDRAFRPVNLSVAPDGTLWVVDMHRVIIEHPEWIPDEIEKTLDLNAGKNQGRVFRISPKTGARRLRPYFDRDNIAEVVRGLESPNQWWRMTAQRLLVQWNDPDAVRLLEDMARDSKSMVARAHALWTLDGMNELADKVVIDGLGSADNNVREQAMRLAGERMNSAPEVKDYVISRAAYNSNTHQPEDQSPRVRAWAALAVSRYNLDRSALRDLVQSDAGAPFADLFLLPGLARDPAASLSFLLQLQAPADNPGRYAPLTALLSEAAATRIAAADAAPLFEIAATQSNAEVTTAFLSGLAEGLESNRAAFAAPADRDTLSGALAPLLKADPLPALRQAWRVARALDLKHIPGQEEALRGAEAAARDASLATDVRVQNLQVLEFASFAQRANLLYSLLDTHQPRELQREAIEQLQREGTPEVGAKLIALWRTLGPETRRIAGDTLLYKRANQTLLLSALEDGTISIGEMDFHLERRRALLFSRDPEIVRRAQALFTDAGVVTRKDAIAKMAPALNLKGDPAKGKAVFTNTCARCHTKGKEGGDIGPNLSEIYRKSRETLLHDILDPNAAADQRYLTYTIDRKNGEIVSGLIAEETDAAVTLRDANGVRTTVPRGDIKDMIGDGLSLMPEELETGMDPQAMADLLAYLQERE